MKPSVVVLCFFLSWNLISPGASPAEAVEATVLARQTGLLMGPAQGVCEVRKLKDAQGITIAVVGKNGSSLWKSEPLGEDDKTFLLGEMPTTLALQDLDGDGLPEILVSAFIGPRSSGLYVFRYDASTKGFVAIPCRFPKEGLERDCLISDVHQASGGDLVIRPDGTAQVLGMIYSEDSDEPPTPGLWTFAFQGGAFVHQATEKLPPFGD